MSRRLVVLAFGAAVVALALAAWWGRSAMRRPSAAPALSSGTRRSGGDEAALARLRMIPFYRALVESGAVRSGTLDADQTVHVEIDLRTAVEPRLSALGLTGGSALLPAIAAGTIFIASPAGVQPAILSHETWFFAGPAPVFDLLDRSPAGPAASRLEAAIPGAPTAVVRARLKPSRLADPTFGGTALASWRDRADVVEKLLGRPIRAEFADDLAGPAVFALYESADGTEAEALAAFELRRSDRLSDLLETLFGLGALTERATVSRYRGVATGSFVPASGGAGLALAVDGSILFIATSRARLESAIDGLRQVGRRQPVPTDDRAAAECWSAQSRSAFVARGWSRLTRAADRQAPETATMAATIRPNGADGWRLDGRGPAPAITADPVVPFLRSVFAKRQREGG